MRIKASAGTSNNHPPQPQPSYSSRGARGSCHSAVLLVLCTAGLTWTWIGNPGTASLLSSPSSGTTTSGAPAAAPAEAGGYELSGSLSSRMTSSLMNHGGAPPRSIDAGASSAGGGTAAAAAETPSYVPLTNSLAYQQSFGFFDNLDDFDWRIRIERAKDHKHQRSPDHKKATTSTDVNQWYLANYYPLFTCPHQERVGFGGDGAKWVCDPWRLKRVLDQPVRQRPPPSGGGGGGGDASSSSSSAAAAPPVLARRDLPHGSGRCLVYSVGCHGNYVFEDGLVDMLGATTCEIHVFDLAQDYTRPGDATNKDIHFHYWGLSSSYSTLGRSKQFNYLTLRQTMEKLGHVGRTIDIFKIDCEHCEWTTFKDWISDDVDVRQLLIETHRLPVKIGVQPSTFFDGIERAGFAMFSKEPNIHPDAGGKSIEWGYVKLRGDFFPPPVKRTLA